jgi:16S rRNA processing protein RimM
MSEIAHKPAPPDASDIDDLTTWNVVVGRISGRWDRAGLKLQPFSTVPDRFAVGQSFCINQNGTPRQLTIVTSRKSGGSFIVDCGISTVEEAEAMRGAELLIHPSIRPTLPDDEFYLDELIGLRVKTESGDDLGEIEEILESKAHLIYVTPQAMIPGVPEFIARTDWHDKVLWVRDIPGLRTDEEKSE